jgi:hypothetical protein
MRIKTLYSASGDDAAEDIEFLEAHGAESLFDELLYRCYASDELIRNLAWHGVGRWPWGGHDLLRCGNLVLSYDRYGHYHVVLDYISDVATEKFPSLLREYRPGLAADDVSRPAMRYKVLYETSGKDARREFNRLRKAGEKGAVEYMLAGVLVRCQSEFDFVVGQRPERFAIWPWRHLDVYRDAGNEFAPGNLVLAYRKTDQKIGLYYIPDAAIDAFEKRLPGQSREPLGQASLRPDRAAGPARRALGS